MKIRSFGSDNQAGVHPDVMQALIEANVGHVVGYGDDDITRQTVDAFRKVLDYSRAEVFFVFAGTPANVLGLRTMASSYNGVICAETAHIYGSECGASEKFIGCKLLPVPTHNGKITLDCLERFKNEPENPHSIQPKVVSLTQPTEYGTLYTVTEIMDICEHAHEQGWYVHMDGARIANAVAALGCDPSDTTGGAGVDVLSFGGTKNGMMFGEAVVIFEPKLAENFPLIRMQGMQLASKMRFISAQFLALLKDGLWLKNARHANKMAQALRHRIAKVMFVNFTQPTETNQVFAHIPKLVVPHLQKEFFFYEWGEGPNEAFSEVRFVTSFDTTLQDVEEFATHLEFLINTKARH